MPDKLTEQTAPPQHDSDAQKGGVETDNRTDAGSNTSIEGQLPHRNPNPLVDGGDSDFPEPGQNPEHSGQLVDAKKGVSSADAGRAKVEPEKITQTQ
jgi:hypothetical protein